ncbi:metallothionein [Roseofilum sp. BLCC_M154]|uniref:Metallothionein n=1 Tax=Roseofilum acuticapitatum BLCC-M154 TaxID=3022444 RepID=A0ABT7B0Z5_9CYAN|nr:metallothionein [Roseofilum acuticapitatum]MDJ1171968.1 metallothionein [Roseofilum acuticapitatum BLCC-M154]
MATATQLKCACESCSCKVDETTGVKKNGQVYCSEACANGHPDGSGCGHEGCDCHK